MAPAVEPGSVLGYYTIDSLLGRGGMGVVYKAVDVRLQRTVAVKLVAPHFLASRDALRRFEREARAISALNHPNIAILYDVGLDPCQPYMVLEYLPGGSLRDRLAGRRLDWEPIAAFALQIGSGLAHAHSHAIVHRDLKPGNVMFTAEGTLKLVDFGLARFSSESEATAPGSVSGTVAYMAPEQATGGSVDHRADIFSFGVVLYEMAAGHVPFRAERAEGVIHQLLTATPVPIQELRPDLPEHFGRALARALAKHPDERYGSVNDFLRELGAPPVRVSLETPPLDETVTMPGTVRVGPKRRWVVPALLLAVLLLLGGVRRALRSPAVPPQKHIAVLPFENIGKDPANQAFCDGMMEILTSALTQMEQFQGSLLVIPASEVRSEAVGSVQKARKLFGVNLALTGSIQRLPGNRVRVTANLVDAVGQRQMRSFVDEAEDAGSLQDLLVRKVASMLQLELKDPVRGMLDAARRARPGADELCVRGYGYLRRFANRKDLDLATEMFQKALAQDPQYALAHALLAQASWEQYDRTKQTEWLSRASEESQRALQLNAGLALPHVTMGLVQRSTGNDEQAVREFQRALEIDPLNGDALRRLASVYEDQGKLKEAEATYRRAIAMRPAYWANYRALGTFYFRNKRYPEAAQAFRAMLDIAPENYRSYLNLGAVYVKMKRYGEAEQAFKKSLALQPLGRTYSNLGTVLYAEGRYAEAVPMMQKATELDPPNDVNWANLGDARMRVGDSARAQDAYGRAAETARKALAVNPKDAALLAHLGFYYAKIGNRTSALDSIDHATQLAPRNPDVLFYRVRVYELAHDRRVWTALESALAAGVPPDDFQADEDLKQMRADPHYNEVVKRFSTPRARE